MSQGFSDSAAVPGPRYFVFGQSVWDDGAWTLGELTDAAGGPLDQWQLKAAGASDAILRTTITRPGPASGLSFAGYAALPVLTEAARNVLARAQPDLCFRPVEGAGRPLWLLCAPPLLDCVDEAASRLEVRRPDDPVRPDLAGQYTSIFSLCVDPARTEGRQVFALARQPRHIVVTAAVRAALDAAQEPDSLPIDWRDANGGSFLRPV